MQPLAFLLGLLLLAPMSLLVLLRSAPEASGQINQPPAMDVGVTVTPSIDLRLSEGTNQFGKKTFFAGNAIDFGNVTFTHPEQVANGDAYLEQGLLKLEAVLNIDVAFGGSAAVALDLTKLKVSPNPYHQSYYSLSVNRSDVPNVVFEDPQRNRLTTLSSGATIPLRMTFVISPAQHGHISDRFRLEANAL